MSISGEGAVANEIDHVWIWREFKHTLQALASPPPDQVRLYPERVCVEDEFAFDYWYWVDVVRHNYSTWLFPNQTESLARLDDAFKSVNWDDDQATCLQTLESDPIWKVIRDLAGMTLRAFEFPLMVPAEGR